MSKIPPGWKKLNAYTIQKGPLRITASKVRDRWVYALWKNKQAVRYGDTVEELI